MRTGGAAHSDIISLHHAPTSGVDAGAADDVTLAGYFTKLTFFLTDLNKK